MNELIKEDKVILIDWGLFLHRAIFAWETMRKLRDEEIAVKGHSQIYVTEPCYLAVQMVITNLKHVGVNSNDLLLVAVDGRGNWRKDVDPNYKANRKAVKQADDIDWLRWYKEFDEMVDVLKKSTPFKFIRIPKLEADDIIAVAVKHWKDKECIVISTDSDFEQLVAYKNVKLFSPITKNYKHIKNPYKILESKFKKEKTDNLITPIISEADFKRRQMIVSLLSLPDFVEKLVLDEIKKIEYNGYEFDLFPFPRLKERFNDIYKPDMVVSFEKSLKKKLKEKKIKKTKKEKENGTKGQISLHANSEIQ